MWTEKAERSKKIKPALLLAKRNRKLKWVGTPPAWSIHVHLTLWIEFSDYKGSNIICTFYTFTDICISSCCQQGDSTKYPRSGVYLRFFCPCKNSLFIRRNQPRQHRLSFNLQGKMKIKINVRVNLTKEGHLFTIWPKSHQFLPNLEFYTGNGATMEEAIDDEFAVRTASLEPVLHKPFEIVHSNRVRVFLLS